MNIFQQRLVSDMNIHYDRIRNTVQSINIVRSCFKKHLFYNFHFHQITSHLTDESLAITLRNLHATLRTMRKKKEKRKHEGRKKELIFLLSFY